MVYCTSDAVKELAINSRWKLEHLQHQERIRALFGHLRR